MMAASVSQVRGWTTSVLTEVAADVVDINERFDDTVKHVESVTCDTLANWEGDASVAVAARTLAERMAGSYLVAAVDTYSKVFGSAARELGSIRDSVVAAVDTALAEGFDVADNGHVIAPTSATGDIGLDVVLQASFDDRAHGIESLLRPLLADAAVIDCAWASRLQDAVDAIRTLVDAPAASEGYSRAVRAVLDGDTPLPNEPAAMAEFWRGLTDAEKDGLAAWDPTIGNRDGLPAVDKSRYNLAHLGTLVDDARVHLNLIESRHPDWMRDENLPRRGERADEYSGWLDEREAMAGSIAGYDTVRSHLDRAGVDTFLMNIDHNGRAALALGNPDTSGNVATYVPGTSSSLATIGGDMSRIAGLLDSSNAHSAGPNSVVAWLGYTAPPDLVDTVAEKYADAGAPRLDRFQDGLRAAHFGPPSHNTVIGHDYGSTVIGHAMRDNASLAVDNVVFVGSPGVGVRRVDELTLDGVDPSENGRRIFATAAAADPVTWGDELMPEAHGFDPTTPYFGATVFDSEPGTSFSIPGLGDIDFSPSLHSDYFETWSPSLDTMGRIIAGRGPAR
ncbi:alpha/beta hydrolase [Rhodococcus sp. G-MC3]|uniref:alpha/beta hydrolase n=1 Tax=Rhodococcus sp. G-MC3 TaxID=3046209 RepID=UPI0024BAE309|nr:alpha/beta hydrolase [Rhodococcus sp. G-MC3]MDJ0396347.1 alpha/beta hydrolase [Rhodococcus sp. G-MC3]